MNVRRQVLGAAILPLLLAAAAGWIQHGWVGYGLYKIALLVTPFLFGIRAQIPRRMNSISLAVALSSGAVLGLVGWGALHILLPRITDPAAIRAAFDARYHYTPLTAIMAALFIATANAVLEEWFYRGFLDDAGGTLLSLSCFSLQHFLIFRGLAGTFPALLVALAVIPAGWIWSKLNKRHGLASSCISHIMTDVFILIGGLSLLGYLEPVA